MHWLQTLDTNLFLFVNRSLANPFFDWLMPVLSGNSGVKGGFILLAVAAGLALLCFGNRRARLFVLLMVLIVATNDGLLCNTLKHAVARPRPFVTLPEARVFGIIGKGYVPPDRNGRQHQAATTACRRRTPPIGLRRRWSRFFFTGAACGSCCRWRWPFPFRAFTTACIIRATFWPARFWARATPPPPSSGCRPPGTGSGKNGFRSGTRKCHRC